MTDIINMEDLDLQELLKEKVRDASQQKLYFLKLSENFFKDKRIKLIKKIPGGYEYLALYMEMMTLSLRSGGFIVKEGYMDDFIYQLSIDLDGYSKETIASGLVLFLRFNLIETDKRTYCEMLQVEELTLSETKAAQYKRDYRKKLKETEKKKATEKEIEENFEKLWKLYPKKRGKGQVGKRRKKEIYEDIGFEGFKKAIMRYISEITQNHTPEQYVQMGSTFFNSGCVDYLDENYEIPPSRGGLKALGLPQEVTEKTNRTDQILENIMSKDGVFSSEGLKPENFKAEKFSEIELNRIYAVYPELRK